MNSRIPCFIFTAVCGVVFALTMFAQERGGAPGQLPRFQPSDKKFDPA